jgi:hypothetical protein
MAIDWGRRVHESLKDKLAVYGQRTYVGAWALEIVASILGLTTGIALGYQAFSTATAHSTDAEHPFHGIVSSHSTGS